MRSLIILFLFILSFSSYSQSLKDRVAQSGKLYDAGVDRFANKDYKAADSLFGESLKAFPHKDTYFNRAVAKKYLRDEAGFQQNLVLAMENGDTAARKLFYRQCVTIDTLFITEDGKPSSPSGSSHKMVCRKAKAIEYNVCERLDDKGNLMERYVSEGQDTVYDIAYSSPDQQETIYNQVLQHLRKTLKYPTFEMDAGIQGTVLLSFILYMDGTIKDIVIFRSPNDALAAAAIHSLTMPVKFSPLSINGKFVSSKMIMPVKFSLR